MRELAALLAFAFMVVLLAVALPASAGSPIPPWATKLEQRVKYQGKQIVVLRKRIARLERGRASPP